VLQVAIDDAASGIGFGISFCLTPTFDRSSKEGRISSYATAGIALWVNDVLKTPHHDKVKTPTRRILIVSAKKK